MKKNQTNNSTNWKNEVNEIRARLEAVKTRSCWDRGVKGFALDILGDYSKMLDYAKETGGVYASIYRNCFAAGC